MPYLRNIRTVIALMALASCLLTAFAGWSGACAETEGKFVLLPSGQVLTLTQGHIAGTTTFAVSDLVAGRPAVSAAFTRGRNAEPRGTPSSANLIGVSGSHMWILTDSYRSIVGGLSMCQAGQERFLRVLAVTHYRLRETLRLKLESCRDNIELNSEGLRWMPDSMTLSVGWLMSPYNGGKPETRIYRVDAFGAVKLIPARRPPNGRIEPPR
jgi:hypothetical protein